MEKGIFFKLVDILYSTSFVLINWLPCNYLYIMLVFLIYS